MPDIRGALKQKDATALGILVSMNNIISGVSDDVPVRTLLFLSIFCCITILIASPHKEVQRPQLPRDKIFTNTNTIDAENRYLVCLLTGIFVIVAVLMDGQRKDATHSTIWLMPLPLLMNYAKLCPRERSHMFIMKAAGVLGVP